MTNPKTRSLERILIVCLLAALFSSMIISARLAQKQNDVTLRELESGWYYYENDQKIYIPLPNTLDVADGRNLTLYYDDLTPEDGSRTIAARGAAYWLRMTVDDHQIYKYDDRGFPRSQPMRARIDCLGILPEAPQHSRLALTYYNNGTNHFCLKPVFIGRSAEVLRMIWYKNMLHMLSVFTMSIIGAICLCAHFYLRYLKMEDSRMGSAALFLVLCSAWSLLGSSLAQQLWGSTPKLDVMALYAFLSLPIPLIHFVRRTQNMYRYYTLDFLLYAAYADVLGQAMFHILLNVSYIDMMPISHTMHMFICGTLNYLLFREYRENKDFEVKAVLQGITVLSAAGLVDLVTYWVFRSPLYGMVTNLGVLIFIVRMLFAILSTVTSGIRFKAEAMVYRRLSREDRLTGLGNRRAFDECLAEIDDSLPAGQDPALFFMDVNGLKAVNDRYGHHAGDELIMDAARCISEAFSRYGTCYRLGGDEFAAVLPEAEFPRERWKEMVDQAVARQNTVSHWTLSVAWGVSYLRDRDGNPRRSSDWLFEADQAMYRMKTLMKASRKDGSEEEK